MMTWLKLNSSVRHLALLYSWELIHKNVLRVGCLCCKYWGSTTVWMVATGLLMMKKIPVSNFRLRILSLLSLVQQKITRFSESWCCFTVPYCDMALNWIVTVLDRKGLRLLVFEDWQIAELKGLVITWALIAAAVRRVTWKPYRDIPASHEFAWINKKFGHLLYAKRQWLKGALNVL